MPNTDLVPVGGAERDDRPVVTKAFMAEFQELAALVRGCVSDLTELEQQCFNRGTPLSRRRAHEVTCRRDEMIERLAAAERELKAEFDRYAVRQQVSTRR
jgi:hypothetical protein